MRILQAARAMVLMAALAAPVLGQQAVGTAFTYQGQLQDGGQFANGLYDLRFRLYDASADGNQVGAELCADDVNVNNGLFILSLDFGSQFVSSKRFLEVWVRADHGTDCSDDTGYTILTTRQELTPAPFAVSAQNATMLNGQPASAYATLGGNDAFTGKVSFTNPANSFTGSFSGDGSSLTNLNGASIQSGSVARASLASDIQQVLGTPSASWDASPPQRLGAFQTAASPRAMVVIGTYAYIAEPSLNQIEVVDVGNPALPTSLGAFAVSSAPQSLAVWSGNLYVLMPGQIAGYSLSDPLNPTFVGVQGVSSGVVDMTLALGTYLCVAGSGNASLYIFQVTPQFLVSRSITSLGISPSGIATFGNLVAISSASAGEIVLVNIQNPTSPAVVATIPIPQPGGMAMLNGMLYAGSADSFRVYDISAPATPKLVGVSSSTIAAGDSVVVSGGRAFVAGTANNEFLVYDVTASNAPRLLAVTGTGPAPRSVTMYGNSGNNIGFVLDSQGTAMEVLTGGVSVSFGQVIQAGEFAGSGAALTGLDASNISGGTLPGSTLTGVDGGGLANLNASALTSGTVPGARLSGTYPSALSLSNPGNILAGDGSALQSLNASNLSTGTLPNLRLSGTYGNTVQFISLSNTFDGSFQGNGSLLTLLSATNISSGTLADGRLSANVPLLNQTNVFRSNMGIGINATTNYGLGLGNTTGNTKLALWEGSGTAMGLGVGSGTNQFRLHLAGQTNKFSFLNGPAGTEVMTLTGAGLLGVGNTSPTAALDVLGGPQFNQVLFEGSDVGGEWLTLANSSSGGRSWNIISTGSGNSEGAGRLIFHDATAQATRMMIDQFGTVTVPGLLAKGGGSFVIDHPLDPENKLLYHSFVESPDMMNVYNGNVTTGNDGVATVQLPDYFEALNSDFRYQLTVLDESDAADVVVWAKVIRKVQGNTFVIRTSAPRMEVSWQVTGVRKDAFAEQNRIPNSVDKPEGQRGKYMHPQAFGQPAEKGIFSGTVPARSASN